VVKRNINRPVYTTDPAGPSGADELLIDMIIGLWRIEQTLDASVVGQRVADISTRLTTKLNQAGYSVQDKTGQFYDPGMPLKVLTSISQDGLTRPTILETVVPTILRHDQMLHAGQVVVGVPARDQAKGVDTNE
jgi:hypothetical protein